MRINIDISFRQKADIIQWIQEYFKTIDKEVAIIGISGGRNSAVAAALCAEALGPHNIIAITMPNGYNDYFSNADKLIEHLQLPNVFECNIEDAFQSLKYNFDSDAKFLPDDDILTSGLRLTILKAYADIFDGAIVNPVTFSKNNVSKQKPWGDFAPLKNFLDVEVIGIGRALRLPEDFLIEKYLIEGIAAEDIDKFFIFHDNILNVTQERIRYLIHQSSNKFITGPINAFSNTLKDHIIEEES